MCFSIVSENWVWIDLHGIYLVSVCGCIWVEAAGWCAVILLLTSLWGEKGDIPWQTVLLSKVSSCVQASFPSFLPVRLMFPICLRLESFCTGGCNPHGCKRKSTETEFMFQNSQGMTNLLIAMGSRLDHAETPVEWLWINVCDNIPLFQSCS